MSKHHVIADELGVSVELVRQISMKLNAHRAARCRESLAKLTERDVLRIRYRLEYEYATLSELASDFGVSISQIARIRDRKAWKHVD